MLSLFHKCGLDFTTRLGQTHNQTSWQYLCSVFIHPWFQRNFANEGNRLVSNKDESIAHAYIKTTIESKNKAGLPAHGRQFAECRETVSTLITSFMKELFNRRLVTFTQLSTDIVHVSSFLDCILDVESVSVFGLPLNDHNRHVMIQLIVTHFYKFIGKLSDDQLVRVAYRTVSKIPEIKREVMAFCLSSTYRSMVDNQAEVDLSWVISELRDIISTGLKGMQTLRRLNKLNLPENGEGLDDEDIIAGLKRHLKSREKEMKKLKNKAPLYAPEVNKYVTTNCGLIVTANNALIVGKFILKVFHNSAVFH